MDQNVKHSQFGEGKVISISGEGNSKKATVFFNGIGQKQLLLKFAKTRNIRLIKLVLKTNAIN